MLLAINSKPQKHSSIVGKYEWKLSHNVHSVERCIQVGVQFQNVFFAVLHLSLFLIFIYDREEH